MRVLSHPRDWYFIAERPAPAPHIAHPEGCAALRIVIVTVPRVSRSCGHFPDEFDLNLLHFWSELDRRLVAGRREVQGYLT